MIPPVVLRIVRTSLLVTPLLLTGAEGPALAGNIQYPALGHFDPEEGTLEVWLTPMADDLYPALKEKEYRGGFALLAMSVPEHFSFSGGWGSKANQHGLFLSMHAPGRDKALLPVIAVPKQRWEKGQPHHVAFTWKGTDMRIFLDGRQTGGRNQARPFTGKMAGQTVLLGNRENRGSAIILHAVRFSSVARTEPMLARAMPLPDIYTTLLDRFDQPGWKPDGDRTRPVQSSGMNEAGGGLLNGNWTLVNSPRQGIALCKQAAAAAGKGRR